MNNRSVQRLELSSPLRGSLDREPALILNLSLRGALARCSSPRRAGERVELAIEPDPTIKLTSRVTRCVVGQVDAGRTRYDMAVTWHLPDLEALSRVRQLLIDLLMKEIAEWRNNATGGDPSIDTFPGYHFDASALSASFPVARAVLRWHRLVEGRWISTTVREPSQPVDGFCVTSDVEPDELEMLRHSFERADEAGRRLIRHLAALASLEHVNDSRTLL